MKPLKVYWSDSLKDGRRNFGDWLSPLLCEKLSGGPVVHARPGRCDLVAVGSVLQRLKNHWWTRQTRVWGAGLIEELPVFRCRHKLHALRGRLTDGCLRHDCRPVFGDPGLLADMISPEAAKKIKPSHTVGIVPHYKDRDAPAVREFLDRNPSAVMIDVLGEPGRFLGDIADCRAVLSSSLHGLAAADSLGVPNAWIRLSGLVRGMGFKFRDYYSVFGINAEPFEFTGRTAVEDVLALAEGYARPGLESIKRSLVDAFPFKP